MLGGQQKRGGRRSRQVEADMSQAGVSDDAPLSRPTSCWRASLTVLLQGGNGSRQRQNFITPTPFNHPNHINHSSAGPIEAVRASCLLRRRTAACRPGQVMTARVKPRVGRVSNKGSVLRLIGRVGLCSVWFLFHSRCRAESGRYALGGCHWIPAANLPIVDKMKRAWGMEDPP